MNQYCSDIEFNMPLVNDIKILDRFKNVHHHVIAKKESQVKFLNPDLYNLFDSMGLNIWLITVFYKIPDESNHIDKKYNIHIDGDPNVPDSTQIRDVSKINWVYNAGNSVMNWYSIKPNVVKTMSTSAVKTYFLKYDRDEVDLVYSKALTKTHIVQIGVPHDVTNISEPRLCVSVALSYKDNPLKRLTMGESLEIFKDYLV